MYKDVEGYEGLYYVTESGDVHSHTRFVYNPKTGKEYLRKGKRLSFEKTKGGYLRVILSKNGVSRKFSVHRLVAIAFIPNPENKPEVNHKDGNKENNQKDNLEWNTASENVVHAFENNLRATPKVYDEDLEKKIRGEYRFGSREFGVIGLSKKYGISKSTVHNIVKGGDL